MSLLNDGKLQKIVGNALGSSKIFGEAMTLRVRAAGVSADGVPNGAYTNFTLTGTLTNVRKYRKEGARTNDSDLQIILYQLNAPATPDTSFQVIARGVTYEILDVTPDPAAATWVLNVRPLA